MRRLRLWISWCMAGAGLLGLATTLAIVVSTRVADPAGLPPAQASIQRPSGGPIAAIPMFTLRPPTEFSLDRPWIGTPHMLPVQGWFSDGYKWRQDPITGQRRFHRGLDIVAPAGSVVRAPADGFVAHASAAGGYGNLVELDHGPRYKTRFAHLEKFLVEEGEIVRTGDPIGLVGSSGRAKGAHLHYEVLDKGRRVNPWPFLGNRRADEHELNASLMLAQAVNTAACELWPEL